MKSIKDIKSLTNKKIIIRADLNVPIKEGNIVDDFRIKKVVPTIQFLQKKGAKIIIISHLGEDGTESLDIVAKRMKAGFGISLEKDDDGNKRVIFDRCILRDICTLRGIETGKAMCRLFHYYFDGIINELINRPVKSEILECGKICRTIIMTQ